MQCFEFTKNIQFLEITKGTTVAVMSDIELDKFNSLGKMIGMKYKINDLTKDALVGKLNNDLIKNKYLMTNIINRFILENASVDDILDKINLMGIKSLTNIDKQILNFQTN